MRRTARTTRARSAGRPPRAWQAPGVVTLAELAYLELRRRIVFQDLPAGEVLDERSLVRALGLGRTPIREAVQRLQREGLVKVFPRRGVLVADMSLETLRQVFETRAPVEVQVARCAALRADRSDVERLQATLAPVDDLIAARDFRGLVEADEAFHLALADAARNPLLRAIVADLYGLGIRFWYSTLDRRPPADITSEMALHREVLRAVEERNADKAAQAMLDVVGTFPEKVGELLWRTR
jgi:DNA-binding GntR family transcriptional regulator